jgi:hypothetical protein
MKFSASLMGGPAGMNKLPSMASSNVDKETLEVYSVYVID